MRYSVADCHISYTSQGEAEAEQERIFMMDESEGGTRLAGIT